MNFTQWFRDGWSIFFALLSAAIFVTLTAPALFGLHNFTQWGGMYDDHWCHADVYSSNPFLAGTKPEKRRFTAGEKDRRVFSAPAHNYLTCAAWTRQFCSQKIDDAWEVTWVSPMVRGVAFLDKQNACTLASLRSTDSWFFHAPKK